MREWSTATPKGCPGYGSVAKTVVSPIAGRVDSLARAGVIAGTNAIAPTIAMVRNFINSPPGPCFRSPDKTVANRPTDRSEGNRQVEAGESRIPDGEEVVDLGDLAVCDCQDLERSQSTLSRLAALVGGKSRAAIRAGGHQAEAPSGLAAKELGLKKPADRGSALVPERQRRHCDQGILAKEGHEARGIRCLPRLHIARKERRRLLTVGGAQRPLLGVVGLHRNPGPVHGAIDGSNAGLEKVGDLSRLPPEHIPEDQRRPLATRQRLERGEKGKGDTLAGVVVRLGIDGRP